MSSDLPKTSDCLSEESLHAVLAGAASPRESAHVHECRTCQAALRRLEAESTILQYTRSTSAPLSEDSPAGKVPSAIGKYIVVGQFDDGPAWTTFRGLHAVVHREVLVQVAHAPLAELDAGSAALAAAARPWMVRRPHVATVLDVGVYNNRPYLVVEYDGGLRLDRIAAQDRSPALAHGLAPIAAAFAKLPSLAHPLVRSASLVVEEDDRLTLIDWAAANLWEASKLQPQSTEPTVRSLARVYADCAGNEPLPDAIAQALDVDKPLPSWEGLAAAMSGKTASFFLRRIFGQ